MPRTGRPRMWRAALMVATVALAATVAGLAFAGPAKERRSIVSLPRLDPTTRVVRIGGHLTLLVINLEVTDVSNGVRVHVSCGACRRVGGGRVRVRSRPGARLLDGVNWLLARGRSIRVSLTKHGAVGRVLLLVADRGQRRLVLRVARCLGAAGRSVACPSGVHNPPPGTPATAVAPSGRRTPGGPGTTTTPAQAPSKPGVLTLSAGFDGGAPAPLTPQCAPGTPSSPPRYRGTYTIENSIVGQGSSALEITLPKDPNPSIYPLEACDLITPPAPIGLGTDSYLGLMVYIPVGWTIPDGVDIYEIHFQNIYGAPIMLNLHPGHVTIQLETGACNNFATTDPGCAFRSNADLPSSSQNLPGYYAIPPGAFTQGAWNELVLHVTWSSSSGQIQSYYRTKGGAGWVQSSNITGIPTVQWDITRGCCRPTYRDEVMAYTFAHDTPLSVWLDNVVDGTSLAAVEGAMP